MLNNFVRSNEENTKELLECYKDAIRKYPDELWMNANEGKIVDLLNENKVYHIAVQDEIIGWLAFKNFDSYSVLNGMYVRNAFQGTHLSRDMLKFYFNMCQGDIDCSVISVPKEFYWSLNFYKKYGYEEISQSEVMAISSYLTHRNQQHDSILYKRFND
ncbi:GNAT family N-acetyltransferase [Acidaminobacter sp. JC074]|uniref:GNAT family N-acetyltransferase n=1 Tax=Acidaminobacter sp. JC074 TaxID=2530199 RepID=UPI001F0EC79E|nr:GNAT family N-acetyltransferase [Acidaminobacter sp. JC074]